MMQYVQINNDAVVNPVLNMVFHTCSCFIHADSLENTITETAPEEICKSIYIT